MGFMDELKNLADDNKSETDSLMNDGEQWVNQETGNQFDSEIKQGGEYVEDYLGTQEQGN